MIWGVGAGRKLLKCCGNCCDSERDAGLLFVKEVIRVLRVRYDPPANFWSIVYASLIGLLLVFSAQESDPVIGVVGFDKFDRCTLFPWCIKAVSGVRMSWSLIVEICVNFNVRWEIVLLSPEDLGKLVAECVCLGGRHGGNSSVFQELKESLTCVKVQGP